MEGYRLRSKHGETLDGQLPLQTDGVEAQETSSVSPTLTYTGKAAAGAVSIASVALKPIIEDLGSRVASYWDNEQNKVYSAFADGNVKKEDSWITSVTETATAAAITIYDPNKNLEEMFESVTGTVKRFVVKVYDTTGGTLYGWVRGVSVASNLYTFEIMNNRLSETQSWVGTLGSFDNTSLEKVEIYFYNSSVAFGTGTCFTEEVKCPKEYSKNRELQLKYAETLSNGQYFWDYWRGEAIGVKADATASETVTYNVWSSTAGGSVGPASNVNIDKLGAETLGDHATAVIDHGIQPLYEAKDYDGAALPNAVTEGQAVRPASTLSGVTFTFQVNEDGSVAIVPVAHDSVDSGAPLKIGGKASTSEPTAVATGDRVDGWFDEYGRFHVRDMAYDTSSGANKAYVTNPDSGNVVDGFIDVDSTNLAASLQYFPSATGIANPFPTSTLTLTGKYIDAHAGDTTLTFWGSNDEDTSTGWVQIQGQIQGLTGTCTGTVASVAGTALVIGSVTSSIVTSIAQTMTFTIDFNGFAYRYFRVGVTPFDASNTCEIKGRIAKS